MRAEVINKILGITESYKAPEVMLAKMVDKQERNKLFTEFLKHEKDTSYEWFKQYFEDEHADRKKKKQDFTPSCVATLLSKLTEGNNYHEVAAGTGSIMINFWEEQRSKTSFMLYDPRHYWYHVEELSDRAIPFLIFNMAIRGMNGVALHGDSLTREFKDVYFIRNDTGNSLGFSEIIKMQKTDELKEELKILEWVT